MNKKRKGMMKNYQCEWKQYYDNGREFPIAILDKYRKLFYVVGEQGDRLFCASSVDSDTYEVMLDIDNGWLSENDLALVELEKLTLLYASDFDKEELGHLTYGIKHTDDDSEE